MKRIAHRSNRQRRDTCVIVVLLAASALVWGCETSSTITQGPNPVKCRVTLATPPALDSAGGAGSLAISTQPECAWDAATTTNWISALSPASGQGSGTVSFRVAPYDGASSRDGVIVVNGQEARVSQRAPCRYVVSPSTYGTGASGGSSTFSIATPSECAWTASPDVTWITVASSATGSGDGSVSFVVAPNRDDARSGSIVVGNQRIIVTQASGTSLPPPPPPQPPPPPPPSPTPTPPAPSPAPACTYSLARGSDSVASVAGSGNVNVSTTSTCAWTAVSNATWISVASGASGTGNGSVEYRYAGNTGGQRSGTLTIAGLNFTVTQAACEYSLSRNSDFVGASDGVGSVNVTTTSTCTWTAVSNAAWITVAPGVRTGSGSVDYHFIPNPGGLRTGTVTIAGLTFTVTQPQAP